MPGRKRKNAPMMKAADGTYEAVAHTPDPQMMQNAEDQRPMPLVCKLCPKAATFSDLSHLLTHVASKGHLSNHFKLGLAKDTDSAAAEALAAYEAWYAEFNLKDLLKTRSESREQRQKSNQIRANELSASLAKSAKQPKVSKAKSKVKAVSRPSNPRVWPALSMTKMMATQEFQAKTTSASTPIKVEPETEPPAFKVPPPYGIVNHEPVPYGLWASHQPMALNLPPYRAMQSADGRAGTTPGRGQVGQRSLSLASPMQREEEENEADASIDGVPINTNIQLKADPDEESTVLSEITTSESLDASLNSATEEARNEKFRKKDWLPGQNVFDAATEDQRRLRNQKKDPSVIESLRKDSKAITQDELVMDSTFSVQRIRNVYDDPADAESSVGIY